MIGETGSHAALDRLRPAEAEPGTGIRVESLGQDHVRIEAIDGPVLLVSFERAADLPRDLAEGRTLAASLAEPSGWSYLSFVTRADDWFRSPDLYRCFDRLIEEDYFDEFDRVVFYGAGMGGYAAAAYSVAAPGATVVALAPQATLDPNRAGWDRRFLSARRLDFTSRYGYAPAMAEAAARVAIVYDPFRPLDAMHASLFGGDHVMRLRAPFCGNALEHHLLTMGVLPELVDAAGEGCLDADGYYRLFRARRRYGPYLRGMLDHLEESSRPLLAAQLCRHVLRNRMRPQFMRQIERLEQAAG